MKRNVIQNKKIFMMLQILLVLTLVIFIIASPGCKSKEISGENTGSSESGSENEGSQSGDTENNETNNIDSSDNSTDNQSENTEKAEETDNENSQEIPQQILDLLDEGNAFYESGEYGKAVKSYRDTEIAIDEAGLAKEAASELKSQFAERFEDAAYRVDTARTHHGVAMQLQYEKRFEEAKTELEKALEIYPKYQDAINALESLEALMGLSS